MAESVKCEARSAARAGFSIPQIAARLAVSYETIYQWLKATDCEECDMSRRRGYGFKRRQCRECGRVFDLLDEVDAAEWTYGHDCEEAFVVRFLDCGECYEEIEDGEVQQVIYSDECEGHGK